MATNYINRANPRNLYGEDERSHCFDRRDRDEDFCDRTDRCEDSSERSDRYYIDRSDRSCRDEKNCDSSRREAGKAILNCGCGSVGPLPILDLAGASIINPYSVASVTIDTRGLKNPTVLINFTALINVPIGVLPNITFRLVKCMNGCSQAIGGSYTYSDAFDALHSESFAFQFCDCEDCCGCATYSVEISNATLAQAGTMISGNISALAVEKNCK